MDGLKKKLLKIVSGARISLEVAEDAQCLYCSYEGTIEEIIEVIKSLE